MQYGLSIPNIGTEFADPRRVAALAHEAEAAGWDGFFVWDHIGANWPWPVADPWVMLAAIALHTTHLRLGPLVTPLPRRRPWKVAREAVTLDHLSDGRLIFGAGIGSDSEQEYSCYGEPNDPRLHGAMLDEALTILTGLWSGQPFTFVGAHYQIHAAHFLPPPVQQPRIPIWIAGLWPNKQPFRRAARWDGVCPIGRDAPLQPEDVGQMVSYLHQQRDAAVPFDITCGGQTAGTDPVRDAERVAQYAEAGITWWIEDLNNWRGPFDEQHARLRRGPPRSR